MQRPAALLFDLDGTLVDSARDIAAALSRLSARRGGGEIAVQDVRSLVSQGVTILVRQALGTRAHDDITDVTEFRAILAELPPDPESIYPGVTKSLGLLAESNRPMAIVTNKPEQLSRLLLDQLGLAHFFRAIVGGDTLPMSKPDPAPLLHALGLLGATRDAALMIGDSAVDADAAKAAGIPFALFEGGYGADGCRESDIAYRFATFDDLSARATKAVAWPV